MKLPRATRIAGYRKILRRAVAAEAERGRRLGVIAALMPYAMPRLPMAVLACFDEHQNQIHPLPDQARERGLQRPGVPLIPAQRRPIDAEVLKRNNRGGR